MSVVTNRNHYEYCTSTCFLHTHTHNAHHSPLVYASTTMNTRHHHNHHQVREEGGIPPLVALLDSPDVKVQRAAAGALRTLAFKCEANKNQIVNCNALPTLIHMLRSEDTAIHYEAVRFFLSHTQNHPMHILTMI